MIYLVVISLSAIILCVIILVALDRTIKLTGSTKTQLAKGEKNKPSSQGAAVPASRVGKIFKQYDKDNDGKLTKEEVAGGRLADSFAKIDANSDGKVDQSELETAMAAFAKSRAGGGSQ